METGKLITRDVAMPAYRKSRPATGWLLLLSVLGVVLGTMAQWVKAAPDPVSAKAVAGVRIALDAKELKWIAKHPPVKVASLEYPRYLFRNDRGQWSGLNKDMLDRISAMTGLRFVHVESFSIEHMLERLERGEADMSTTLAMNDERKEFLDFSHSFGGSGWVFVGRAGAPQVESLQQLAKRVLVLPTRHAMEAVIRRDYPAIELRSVKTYAEARALVESGEAHATLDSETGAQLFPAGQLQVGQVVEGQWDPDYLTVRKGQPQLLSILNKALEAFPPAELRALRSKWINGDTPAPNAWQRFAPWGGWGLLVASLFVLLSLLWSRRLAVLVRQRQKAEQDLGDQLAFQHALIDAMPDPLFVRDLRGRLILCNKRYEESLSTRFERIQGRQLIELDLLPKETAELLHEEFMAQLGTRKPLFCERQLMFKTGPRAIYQWTVPFYGADGQLRGLLGGWSESKRRTGQS
jgi:two-component system sensor histidine kinase EvgS